MTRVGRNHDSSLRRGNRVSDDDLNRRFMEALNPDDLVFPSTKGSPRSPGRVRDQLREAQQGTGIDVTPHDFRRTVATQVARGTTLANATALLGHADESTTSRHYVQRIHVAPDLRVVIDEVVAQTSEETLSEGKGE